MQTKPKKESQPASAPASATDKEVCDQRCTSVSTLTLMRLLAVIQFKKYVFVTDVCFLQF